jgi:hypothetical protein
MQEAVRYLVERNRGCTVCNGDTIFVFHRRKRIGVLRGELMRLGRVRTVPSLSVVKLTETEATS